MKVIVQDNQIEKAIRDLKKKLTKEGFFSEIKDRRFYDKPSVQKKKKMAKAAKETAQKDEKNALVAIDLITRESPCLPWQICRQ